MHRRQIRTTPMRHFRRHADAFTQRRMRVNRLADVAGIRAHPNGLCNLTDHVPRVGADHAAAHDLCVAMGFLVTPSSRPWQLRDPSRSRGTGLF